jgi:hypothetical protein
MVKAFREAGHVADYVGDGLTATPVPAMKPTMF